MTNGPHLALWFVGRMVGLLALSYLVHVVSYCLLRGWLRSKNQFPDDIPYRWPWEIWRGYRRMVRGLPPFETK